MPFGFKNAHVIQKVVTNNNGDAIAYGLENGEIIMKEEAVSMAYQGTIAGVRLERDVDGDEYLVSTDGNNDVLMNISNENNDKDYTSPSELQ